MRGALSGGLQVCMQALYWGINKTCSDSNRWNNVPQRPESAVMVHSFLFSSRNHIEKWHYFHFVLFVPFFRERGDKKKSPNNLDYPHSIQGLSQSKSSYRGNSSSRCKSNQTEARAGGGGRVISQSREAE